MLVEEQNSLTNEIENILQKYNFGREGLLPALIEIQRKYKRVSDFAQQEIARLLNIHPVEVHGVVSFFSFLNSKPKGKYIIRICRTISCDMKNKDAVINAIEKELNIKIGETTKDKKFTLEYANCLGLCDESPAMAVNDRVYTKVTPETAVEIINELK